MGAMASHQPHECLLNCLFRRRSKKTSKLPVTGLCEGNSPVTGEFPAQRASNAENVSIWWRHHGLDPPYFSFKVYPKKYAHGFVVLCFVVVMQSFIMNSHEVFIHIHQGCFAGTGAIVRLPQCQWSKPDGYGKISQCITTTKHSKTKTECIFLGIYCMVSLPLPSAYTTHNINGNSKSGLISGEISPSIFLNTLRPPQNGH